MFEKRTETLRDNIAYLEDILSEDSDIKEEDFADLLSFLDTCQEDIDKLKADLPYDEIDEDDIPIEDFSGDNLEDSELEDEVVEVEMVIEKLQQMLDSTRERYFDGDESSEDKANGQWMPSNLSEEEFYQKLKTWLEQAIKDKCTQNGISKSENEIQELRDIFIELNKTKEQRTLALFSPGLNHIAWEMIKQYKLLGSLINFDQDLAFEVEIWKDVI